MIADKHKSLVANIPMTKNRLYQLQLKNENLYACNVSTPTKSDLWYLRYGHLPIESMILLQRQSMLKGLLAFSDHISSCTSCIMGKHKRDSFASSSNRAKEQLELVHIDLCGLMKEK